jgi:hypothetical protein
MFTQSSVSKLGCALAFWVVIHTLSLTASAAYGGGSGTPDDPYLIFTAEQLNAVGAQPGDWDKHFRLMADIDLSGYRQSEFHRIGTPEHGRFTGTFDGNYRTISNFQWSREWDRYVGLFGIVEGEQAVVKNVTLVNPSVTSDIGAYVGALVGVVRTATISNCHVRGGTVSGENCVGGLVGRREGGTITDCTVTATVCGANRVGGLLGHAYWGLIERCSAAGQVTADSVESECWAAGGLIGEHQNGTVADCYAHCSVKSQRGAGGLIGQNGTASVYRCWADGVVSGGQDVGGLMGRNDGGTITDCYCLTDTCGGVFVGGLVGQNGPSCDCIVHEDGLIERCYAAGPVSGTSDLGGLVAVNKKGRITDCFWDMQTTGSQSSAGGSGMTTLQMQSLSTYAMAGWDFDAEAQNGTQDIWCALAPGSYPRLAWQTAAGDVNGDGNVDFRDFAILAAQWRRIDSGFWSHGTFMAADGVIDLDDLGALAQAWLSSGR